MCWWNCQSTKISFLHLTTLRTFRHRVCGSIPRTSALCRILGMSALGTRDRNPRTGDWYDLSHLSVSYYSQSLAHVTVFITSIGTVAFSVTYNRMVRNALSIITHESSIGTNCSWMPIKDSITLQRWHYVKAHWTHFNMSNHNYDNVFNTHVAMRGIVGTVHWLLMTYTVSQLPVADCCRLSELLESATGSNWYSW